MLLIGCAGSFPYKYYALDAEHYEGYLRGPDPKFDIPLSECRPTDKDKAPCMVFKTSEFLKAKLEFKDMQNRLKKCGG